MPIWLSLLEHEPEKLVVAPIVEPAAVFVSAEPMLVISPRMDTAKEWGFKVFSVEKQIPKGGGVID